MGGTWLEKDATSQVVECPMVDVLGKTKGSWEREWGEGNVRPEEVVCCCWMSCAPDLEIIRN